MLFSTLLTSLAVVTSVVASPLLVARTPACAWNSVQNVTWFTLLAVNLNDNTVEREIVLGTVSGLQPNVSVFAVRPHLPFPI